MMSEPNHNYCHHHEQEVTGYKLMVDFAIIDGVRHKLLDQYEMDCGCVLSHEDAEVFTLVDENDKRVQHISDEKCDLHIAFVQ